MYHVACHHLSYLRWYSYLPKGTQENQYKLRCPPKEQFRRKGTVKGNPISAVQIREPQRALSVNIRVNTRLCNFDPLKPHFYIVKLVFTGVYIIFLISAQKHRLWYSLEPPQRGGSNEYPQSMFFITKTCLFKYNENFTTKK